MINDLNCEGYFQLFQKQPMSDAIRRLFYSPSSPILSAENRSATLVLAKKWPRMHQILHFLIYFQGRAANSPFQWRRATTVLVWLPLVVYTNTANTAAMVLQCFYRPPQVSCCLLFVRGRLLYSLLKGRSCSRQSEVLHRDEGAASETTQPFRTPSHYTKINTV